MLNGPQRTFCEGIVKGLTNEAAYVNAYPKGGRASARSSASHLLRRAEVREEIARLRTLAETLAGSAVLTLMEKRQFLARVVRMKGAEVPADSDLVQGIKTTTHGDVIELPDKLRALELDAKLAGELAQDRAADRQAKATNVLATALSIIREATHGAAGGREQGAGSREPAAPITDNQ